MNNLEEAASLLENGWCRMQMKSLDGRFCSAGAIAYVKGLYHALNDNDSNYIERVKELEKLRVSLEIKALADEIRESGFVEAQIRSEYVNNENSMMSSIFPSKTVEEYVDNWSDLAVVTYWNDNHILEELDEILEMFKYAAKRL